MASSSGQWYATDRTPLLSCSLSASSNFFRSDRSPEPSNSTFIPVGYMMAGNHDPLELGCRRRLALSPACDQASLDRPDTDDGEPLPVVHTAPTRRERHRVQAMSLSPSHCSAAWRAGPGSNPAISSSWRSARSSPVSPMRATPLPCSRLPFISPDPFGAPAWPPIAVAGWPRSSSIFPWAYWQIVVQPGGNALLRYALAGDYGFDQAADSGSSPPQSTCIRRLGVQGWLVAKLQAFEQLVSMSEDLASERRKRPFLS